MRVGGLVQRRGFASTARRLDHYAFVGLGQMVSEGLAILPSSDGYFCLRKYCCNLEIFN